MLRKIQKLIKPLASLKLAVTIIIALGVISAWGTIVESQADARTAQKIVYHSIYMHAIMILLCINLISVMIDRLPWKSHHAGFILAHVGIITILTGSLITYKYGIDGSMSLDIGSKSRTINLQDREISIYSYFSGTDPELVFQKEVDFISRPVSLKSPLVFDARGNLFEIFNFYNFARREEKIVSTNKSNDGPAIKFRLANDRVSFSKWIRSYSFRKQEVLDLGPAQVILSKRNNFTYKKGNIIFLSKNLDNSSYLNYSIYTEKKKGLTSKGKMQIGDKIKTGWMGLEFLVLDYFPHSRVDTKFIKLDRPTKTSTSALQIKFQDQKFWLGLDSLYRFFGKQRAYAVIYGHKRLRLDFEIELKEFRLRRYQGSTKASSYESKVIVSSVASTNLYSTDKISKNTEQIISMNNPLKHKGFTFYQSSFNEDKKGKPTASILSVNWDPGRFLKYLGSLMIILGVLVLFYFKKVRFQKGFKRFLKI